MLFYPDVGSRSITEFPEAANYLIAALQAEVGILKQNPPAEASDQQKKIISALVTALDAFKSKPQYPVKREPLRGLWSMLEKMYPDRQQTWAKFETIFGEVHPHCLHRIFMTNITCTVAARPIPLCITYWD